MDDKSEVRIVEVFGKYGNDREAFADGLLTAVSMACGEGGYAEHEGGPLNGLVDKLWRTYRDTESGNDGLQEALRKALRLAAIEEVREEEL